MTLHFPSVSEAKRAAALLFHRDSERFFTGAFVKIGYFRTNADLLYHDEIHGDPFTQVEKTVDLLLTKYLKAGISYRGLQRIETFPVPEAALREAVLNAVIHKDYSSGTPIQISVYEDKLMLWNAGELPPDSTVAKLKGKHSSQPFNPDVANAFFRAGMIEAWGRGIELMMEACRAAHAPEPDLLYEQAGMWVVFAFPEAAVRSTTQETTQEKILALLRTEPSITRSDLAERLNLTPDAIKYHLTRMTAGGLIRHVGPTKSGHWEILK